MEEIDHAAPDDHQVVFCEADVELARRSVCAFTPGGESVAAARHFAARTSLEWGHAELAGDVELVTSELASNAVRHAQSSFTLVISERSRALRLAVADASHEPAVPQHPDGRADSGRGLLLIDAISSDWGIEQTTAGKVVWAQLQL